MEMQTYIFELSWVPELDSERDKKKQVQKLFSGRFRNL